MFIKTIKFSKKTAVFILIGLAVVLAVIILLAGGGGGEAQSTSLFGGVKSAEDRAKYLAELGWEVDPAQEQAETVVIPRQFSEAYAKYNELQQAQGFDLTEYGGMQVQVYTYEVKNYKGSDETVLARLYVSKNKVIGGDVHSTALDGFMHGLK